MTYDVSTDEPTICDVSTNESLFVTDVRFERMDTDDTLSRAEPCCKVGRVLLAYGLENLDAELERRWTSQGTESSSLRELQNDVNRSLIRKELATAGISPIEGEVENLQRLLTSSEVSESRRIEARRRLESEGVDVDQLVTDFVSHQTVYNHLRGCRGVSPSDDQSDEERRSSAKSTIFGLQNRTELVTEQTLSQLASSGLLTPEQFDVIVDIQAICENCGRSHDVGTLLETGGCQCE